MLAATPLNASFKKEHGTYKSQINFLDRKETAVQRQIRRGGLGSYEPEFQAALLALCECNKGRLVMYDVGSHIGVYSALVAAIFPKLNPFIVAFEPTPRTADLARQIRDMNQLSYLVQEMAVGSNIGTVDLYLSPKAETSNSLNASFRPGSVAVQVPLTTVDVAQNAGLPAPSIMKIDVETMEANVLRGAYETIRDFKPVVTCEILPKVAVEEMGAALSWMKFLGYSFYRVEGHNKWKSYSVPQMMKSLSNQQRDWIFTPTPLEKDFFAAKTSWAEALLKCTADTNVFFEKGADPTQAMEKMW